MASSSGRVGGKMNDDVDDIWIAGSDLTVLRRRWVWRLTGCATQATGAAAIALDWVLIPVPVGK